VSKAAALLARFANLEVIDTQLPHYGGHIPDFIVNNFHEGRQAICDTKVYNPFSPSNVAEAKHHGRDGYLKLKQLRVEQAVPGQAFAAAHNSRFYAFVFDAFGNTSPGAQEFIKQLAIHHGRVSEYGLSQTILFIRNKLVLAALKGSAAMLRRRYVDSPFDNDLVGQPLEEAGD
jgi:hypothetical protein